MEIMLTCRDCYYGVTGLKSGVISCLKFMEVGVPEAANECKFYNSLSKR